MQKINLHFGVDYYPEHWPKERWETDVKLMKEMGIQMVRLAEFSWHKMEPEENKYDFSWLDEAIDLLGKQGIYVILGTPTAAPPAWLTCKYPQILPVDRDGNRKHFGGRHHTCHSNLKYREKVTGIVTEMAKHFKDNPYVIGWQIDNELGNSHENLCFCDSCATHFRKWLKNKYETIEALNQGWGTAFWSQEYNSFEEISAPKTTVAGENPSVMLDWKLFCSDLIVDFLHMQVSIIRSYCPGHFVTHNYMGFANKVNYYNLGKELDFVCQDQYPLLLPENGERDSYLAAADLDVVRGYKDKCFWIMEQQSGACGWSTIGRGPKPGQLSLWAIQSIAHGADAVIFFRWRTCAIGTEQFWHGILPHSGKPGKRYQELKDMIKEMGSIMEEIQGSMPPSKAAIVFSFKQNYALDIQPQNVSMSYKDQVQKYYRGFYEKNIPVDFISEDSDFNKYKLIVAPIQYLMTPELENKYIAYVKEGGHLILTMRSGVKDANNLCMTERMLPGRLEELVGIEVEDYEGLKNDQIRISWEECEYQADMWSDILRITGKEVKSLAVYASEYYQGTPCITENTYGKGKAYYIATSIDEPCMERLIAYCSKTADIDCLGNAEKYVEFASRENKNIQWLFVMNHSGEKRTFIKDDSYHIYKGDDTNILKPYEVKIFYKNR